MRTMTVELTEATARVQRLRAATLARSEGWTPPLEPELLAARSWWGSAGDASAIVRRGRLAGDILRGLTPEIGKTSCWWAATATAR